MPDITIPFPLGGQFQSTAHAQQPAGTTPSAKNAQAIPPWTGRAEGGQRAGLSKWSTTQVNSTNAPQDITTITKIDDRLTYTSLTGSGVTTEWSAAAKSNRPITSMVTDRQGNVYALAVDVALTSGLNYLCKFNPAGALVWVYPLPLKSNTEIAVSVRIDEDAYIYVCFGNGSTTGRLHKYEEVSDSSILELVWSLDMPSAGSCVDVAISNGSLYVAENTGALRNLHYYDRIYNSAPTLVWTANIENSTTYTTSAVAFAPDGGCIVALTRAGANGGRLRKFGPAAPTGGPPVTPIWEYTGEGVGLGLYVGSTGLCYSAGYGATYHAAIVQDNGTTASLSKEFALAGKTNFVGPNIVDVDSLGDFYIAYSDATGATGATRIYKFASSVASHGAATWEEQLSGFTAAAGGLAVAAYPFTTDAGTKIEFAYASVDIDAGESTLYKLRQTTVTRTEGSPRSVVVLAAAGGDIRRMTTTASNTPTNGGSALSSTARWVQSATLYNRVLYTDGLTYKSYNALTDTVSTWAATSAGTLPDRCRLLVVWNGRAVLAGAENDPSNWYMSAQGDVDDWDYFPTGTAGTVLPTQAVAGNNTDTGKCPDIINCLIPYSDDLLLFGGDKSIYQLTGDPAQNGRFDRICDTTGIAFGSPWCKDEEGSLYFFGSRNQVYRMQIDPMSRTSIPVLISLPIFELLDAIDQSTNRIHMLWDTAEQVLRLYITPYTTGATTHYVWEPPDEKLPGVGGWWPVVYASNGHNPRAAVVLDGDAASDRVVIHACDDGYLRKIDSSAATDDSTAIESYVYLGPWQPGDLELEASITNLRAVFAASSGTVNYDVYYGEEATLANATLGFSGTWAAGRNDPVWERARGQSIWIKVGRYPSPSSGTWALESLRAKMTQEGVVRNR